MSPIARSKSDCWTASKKKLETGAKATMKILGGPSQRIKKSTSAVGGWSHLYRRREKNQKQKKTDGTEKKNVGGGPPFARPRHSKKRGGGWSSKNPTSVDTINSQPIPRKGGGGVELGGFEGSSKSEKKRLWGKKGGTSAKKPENPCV